MPEIDKLEISISSSASKAASGIDKLATSLGNLKQSLSSNAININQLKQTLTGLSSAFNSIQGVEKIRDLGKALSGVSSVAKIAKTDFTSAVNGIGQFVTQLAAIDDGTVARFERLANAFGNFQGVNIGSAVRQLKETGKAANDTSTLFGRLKEKANEALKPIDKLLSSVGRIGFYRAIRFAISRLTSSISEGIKNLYQWDMLLGDGSFAKSMDDAASAWQNIKNSIGVAIAPIVQSLIPVFQKLAEWIMTAANAVSRFFAILNNSGSYKVVTKTTTTFAESAGLANKNLKEVKKTLLGFDELNLLNDNSTSSGGIGGLADGIKDAFDEQTLNLDKNNFLDNLAITFKNVAFEWENLTEEQWVEKIFAGAYGLSGLIFGLATGHPFLGLALGLSIGLTKGAKIFNNDGELDANEIASALATGISDLLPAWAIFAATGSGGLATITIAAGLLISWAYEKFVDKNQMTAGGTGFSGQFGGIGKEMREMGYGIGQDVSNGFKNGLADEMDKNETPIKNAWQKVVNWVEDLFDIGSPSKVFYSIGSFVTQGFWNGMRDLWSSFQTWATSSINSLVSQVQNAISNIKTAISNATQQIKDFSAKTGSQFSGGIGGGLGTYYQHYASGGSVPSGQIFMAREAGPELVGSIGTQTVVMNNDQIVSAVSDGVYRAVSAAMDGRNSNVTAHLYIDGREVKTSLNRLSRANG